MRWLGILILIAGVAGCGRCGGGAASGDANGLPALGDGSAIETPMPGAIYKQAYERARSEVTADNAGERLDALENAIDRDSATHLTALRTARNPRFGMNHAPRRSEIAPEWRDYSHANAAINRPTSP